jgi:hypothetical protein
MHDPHPALTWALKRVHYLSNRLRTTHLVDSYRKGLRRFTLVCRLTVTILVV